jgi:hypothetical protein
MENDLSLFKVEILFKTTSLEDVEHWHVVCSIHDLGVLASHLRKPWQEISRAFEPCEILGQSTR